MMATGYIRVSTDNQATEGISLEAQEDKVRAWCHLNGSVIARVFVDAMSGGRADNRPQLQAALDEVCRNRGVLVVYSLSRLARSTIDAIAISQRLEKAGADLVSLTEKIDTTTAAGKMVFRMLAVLAEFERDQIRERTTSAMNHLRRKGVLISGKVPFGCDIAGDGQRLLPNAKELESLHLMQRLQAKGKSLREIGAELTARGIVAKTGGAWGPSAVKSILDRARKLAPAAGTAVAA